MKKFQIYVYGHCSSSSNERLGYRRIGKGGYAFSIYEDWIEVEKGVHKFSRTNTKRMKLMGLIESLQSYDFHTNLEIHTNCADIYKNFTSGKISHHRQHDYFSIENSDLWKELDEIIQILDFEPEINLSRPDELECPLPMKKVLALYRKKPRNNKFIIDIGNVNSLIKSQELNLDLFPTDTGIIYEEETSFLKDSICVHAECKGQVGNLEYFGKNLSQDSLWFKNSLDYGTKNGGEFLAIVHALAKRKKGEKAKTIYCSNDVALGWVRKKNHNVQLYENNKNKEFKNLLERAVVWLNKNSFDDSLVQKWDKKIWGENPVKTEVKKMHRMKK